MKQEKQEAWISQQLDNKPLEQQKVTWIDAKEKHTCLLISAKNLTLFHMWGCQIENWLINNAQDDNLYQYVAWWHYRIF